jgi:hypothetical protein
MKARDLDRIETELGLDLPAEYRKFMLGYRPARGDIGKLPITAAMLRSLIVTQPAQLIRLNERILGGEPLAGLPRWPESYFVFGDNGSGDYFILETGSRHNPVLEYDHERDELRRRARSLETFIRCALSGRKQEDVLVHSGRHKRRRRAAKIQWKPPKFDFGPGLPKWRTDWRAFVEEFVALVKNAKSDSQRIARANRVFGSKAVRWEGLVESVRLGEYPGVVIELEPIDKIVLGKLLRFGRTAIGLRTEVRSSAPQIVTSLSIWRDVRAGDRIRFVMMFAPGLRDEPPGCADIAGPYDGVRYVQLQDCGGHLIKILSRETTKRAKLKSAMMPNKSLERTRER